MFSCPSRVAASVTRGDKDAPILTTMPGTFALRTGRAQGRVAASQHRRPLPGQSHPGLGLLKEVFSWLVVICEILELDGLYYSPSSYHVAAQSHHLVRFLHPEHEALYRAFEMALEGIDLASASRVKNFAALRSSPCSKRPWHRQ